MSDYPLVPTPLDPEQTLAAAGQIAKQYAAQAAFADYLSRQSDNTLRDQAASLARFAQFLALMGFQAGDLRHDPTAWRGLTWALVEGFRNWMVQEADAVASVNARLSAVKTYAKLAFKAGIISPEEHALIRVQTHQLSADTLRVLHAWVEYGEMPGAGSLLRGSRKGGALTDTGMSERAVSLRVRELGEQIGTKGLSPHDCRHYWATYWADKVDVLRLQEAGGWSSLAMPRRYVEESEIANEGVA
jgi:integrase